MISNLSKSDKIVIKLVVLIIIAMLFTSCAATKKDKTTVTATTEKVEKTTDKKDKIETSEEIKDRIVVNVPETNNEATMKMVDAVLKQLNTSKSSGSNSYNSTYNAETRQLVIDFIVGQTQNKNLETTSSVNTNKSFDQQMDSYIKKIVIPWWMYVIAIFLLWPHVKWLLNFIPGAGPFIASIGKK